MKNAEKEKGQLIAELVESEEKYRTLVEMATDAVFLETVEGRLLDCNTAGAKMYGYTREEIVGLTIFDLVPEKFTKILPKIITEKETTYGKFVPRISKKKDGTIFHTEIATRIINIGEAPKLVAYVRDVSGRRKTEKKLRSLLKKEREEHLRAETLTKVTLALTSKLRLSEVLEEMFGQVKRLVPYSACNINIIEKGKIINVYSVGYDKYSDEKFVSSFTRSMDELPPEKETVTKAEPLLLSDTYKDSRWIIFKETSWIRSRLSIPVCLGNKVIGLLNLDGDTPGKFVKEDIEKLQPLVSAAAVALENARLFEVVRKEIKEREQTENRLLHRIELEKLVADISAGFVGIPLDKIDDEINRMLQIIGQFCLIDRSYLFLFSEDGKVMSNAHEWCAPGIEAQIRNMQGLHSSDFPWGMEKLNRYETVYIPRVADLPAQACAEKEIFQSQDIKSLLAVPVTHGTKLLGFIGFDAVKKEKSWTKEDITLLRTLGGIIALALEREKTEEIIKERDEKLRNIFENSTNLFYSHTPEHVLTFVSPQVKDILGYTQEDAMIRWTELTSDNPVNEIGFKYTEEAIKTGKRQPPYELEMVKKNGEKIWVEIREFPLVKDGKTTAIIGSIVDITERKQAEENLKNTKDELQMILDSVPALIFYKDTEGRILRVNKTLVDSFKISFKDMVGKTAEEFFHKEQAERMRKSDKEVIASGKPKRNILEHYPTPDGIIWALTDKIPYRDKTGKVTGIIGFAKDITLQRKSEEELKQSYQKLKRIMGATINTVSKIIEAKDPYTAGHQQRVSRLAVHIAHEMKLPKERIEGIKITSLVHDIGKISVPAEILNKPSKLNEVEYSLIKGHPRLGYDILESIDFSYPVAEIILQHHERLDGSGYPRGLKGNKIITEAKIIGVADIVEAMSSHRPYRPALGIDKALEEISKNKGILYDPQVVDTCLKLFREKGFEFNQ